jgi:hypothetical protein
MLKPLPVGIQTFRDLIDGGFLSQIQSGRNFFRVK